VERTILNTSRVAVAGLGLLGGSIAKRLTRIGARSVFGIARRTEVLQAACDADILEAGSDNPAEILPVVDLTVICLPLTASVAFIKQHAKSFRAGSLVTDVGSVKGSVVREVRDLLFNQGVYFIGSHPMAGSEKSGLEHSDADLYQDRIVFLTPTEDDEPEAVELLRIFWDQMGAQVYELPANRHDAAVSRASHVPHLLSSVLVSTVLDDGDVDDEIRRPGHVQALNLQVPASLAAAVREATATVGAKACVVRNGIDFREEKLVTCQPMA